jgi:hypothetical protein
MRRAPLGASSTRGDVSYHHELSMEVMLQYGSLICHVLHWRIYMHFRPPFENARIFTHESDSLTCTQDACGDLGICNTI